MATDAALCHGEAQTAERQLDIKSSAPKGHETNLRGSEEEEKKNLCFLSNISQL